MLRPDSLHQVRWVSRSGEFEEVLGYLPLPFPAASKHVMLCCWSNPATLASGQGGGRRALGSGWSSISRRSPGALRFLPPCRAWGRSLWGQLGPTAGRRNGCLFSAPPGSPRVSAHPAVGADFSNMFRHLSCEPLSISVFPFGWLSAVRETFTSHTHRGLGGTSLLFHRTAT